MTGFEFILWIAGGIVVALVLGVIVPNPFRDKLRLTLGIKLNKGIDSMTTAVERAEARVEKLTTEIRENERKVSNLRGTFNHQKNNVLAAYQRALDEAIADYDLANEELAKTPEDAVLKQTVADQLDRVEIARQDVETQETVVASHQEAVDAAREAIAVAGRELKKLQGKVRSGAAKAKASAALSSATNILEASKDLAGRTTGLGKDLDAIDEQNEQAKARFQDAQGSDSDRRIAALKAQRERSSTADWLAKRKTGEQK